MPKLFTRSLAVGALATLLLSGCSSEPEQPTIQPKVRATYTDGTVGTVKEVKSGNTVSVQLGEQVKDVRLLNVVAPSKNNVEHSGNCLIEESQQFLAEKLPEGTEVTLNFDPSQAGTSGYVDAAVYAGETFINREVVAAGMASTTFATPNDKFYPEVSAAQQEAARGMAGLYSPDVECTIAHEIQVNIDEARAAGEIPEEDRRTAKYKEISAFYNQLQKASESAVTWTGSIVTLDATREKLEELHEVLGDNYYNEDGKSQAEVEADASASARPDGGAAEAPAEEAPAEEAPAEEAPVEEAPAEEVPAEAPAEEGTEG